jgi:hypothetical protein
VDGVKLIGEQEAVLADTGPLCRLAEAGEVQLDVAAEYLAPVLYVVIDVQKEIRRRATKAEHARLTRLAQLDVPRQEALTITDKDILADIEAILARRRIRYPDHEDKDRGELATALAAHSLGMSVLMDDGWGKKMAASRKVDVFTTQDLAVELAALDKLKAIHAYALYRIVYSDASRAEFDQRVEELKAELAERDD